MLKYRTRLILSHLSVIVVVLTFSGFMAYWMLAKVVHRQLDTALLAVAESEVKILISNSPPLNSSDQLLLQDDHVFSFARIDRLVQVIDEHGKVLARSANLGQSQLPIPTNLSAMFKSGTTHFETLWSFGDEPVRMVSVPIEQQGRKMTVQVAGSLDDVHKVLNSASLLFVVMTLGLLAAIGSVGVYLTRTAFQTIEGIVYQAHRIDENNLNERIPHPGIHDEIGNLVDTLNEMLARIEKSFEVQRRFTADAAHELRSPLSRLRTELEISLRRPRNPLEYQETLQSCLDEVDRLTTIVEELLMLARIDAGMEQQDCIEPLYLDTVITSVAERMQPAANRRYLQITIQITKPIAAKITRGALDLILTNILDNAIKFSLANGHIVITLHQEAAKAVLRVIDNGPGILPEERQHLFERFYRGSLARTMGISGAGLGLALAQTIARRHGGWIDASNDNGRGAILTLYLPLADAP